MEKYDLEIVVVIFVSLVSLAMLDIFYADSSKTIVDRGYVKCYIWEPVTQMGHISVKVLKRVEGSLYLVTYNKSQFKMTTSSRMAEFWLREQNCGSCRIFFMPLTSLNLPMDVMPGGVNGD